MPSGYRYDPRTGQYVDPSGRRLAPIEVREELDRVLAAKAREARALAEAYRTRTITLDAFAQGMRQNVKDVHLLGGVAARGGWAMMDQQAYGQVGGFVGREYLFLERFLGNVRTGKQPTDGQFLGRAELYALAGRDTYHQAERDVQRGLGKTEEKNVLHPAEHCGVCLAQTALGWVPIGTLIPIGRRTCLRRDQCTISYR